MPELFASGHIIDLILLLVLAEVIALPWILKLTNTSLRTQQLLPNIVAGACLMLALRLSITGAQWQWLGLALFCALVAHVVDLVMRWNDAHERT